MDKPPSAYPDVSDILARKEEGRAKLAGLSFGQKIARMEALWARLAPMRSAREARRGVRKGHGAGEL